MHDDLAKKELIFTFFEDRRNYQKVFSMCLGAFRDRVWAEDAVHDIFIKLLHDAPNINFPEDREGAMLYIQQIIYNRLFERIRKSKNLPEIEEEQNALEVPSDIQPGVMQKLEKLTLLIRDSRHFTPEQLKLWECIYEFRSLSEMELILGKEKTTIYSLRNKLLSKIRKLFQLEELY
jgi:DNA-directed RNA polymerase specialized sigma24 family protein